MSHSLFKTRMPGPAFF